MDQKSVVIETWGCQMNVADSEAMLGMLGQEGYALGDNVEEADLILLHTCNIREKARHKLVSRLGVLKDIKEKKPETKIIVTGCVVQAEGESLFKEVPFVDILIGAGKLNSLPTLLREHNDTGEKLISIGFDNEFERNSKYSQKEAKPTLTGKNEVSRYVNIIQGCDNYCTYCTVPYVRGSQRSRPADDVVEEINLLINTGAKEITLLGQNVNSYGLDFKDSSLKLGFVELLDKVCSISELDRVRFTTSNPHDFTYGIAEAFSRHKKLGSYLHLPLQSGDNEVLRRMNRRITVEQYKERVGWLRSLNGNEFAISTDFIVGFPGETEEQFENTLKVIEEVEFSFAFAFKYSPRSGTRAATYDNQIPYEEKVDRLKRLNDLQDLITLKHNKNEIGKKRDVLILYQSAKELDVYYGRTPQFRLVKLHSNQDVVGQVLTVEIIDANKTALVGKI